MRLPYSEFRSPVFRMEIMGECCIFMVDTGSTCNLAFGTLTRKFPQLPISPSDQVIERVGGLSTTIHGQLDVILTVGSQTLTCPFLVSDYPISNLDGILGTQTMKRFQSWSLRGNLVTVA